MTIPRSVRPAREALGFRQVLREALRALGPRRHGLFLLAAMAFVQSTLETTLLYLVARLGMSLATGDGTVPVSLGPLGSFEPSQEATLAMAGGLLVVLLLTSLPVARYGANLSVGALIAARSRVTHAWFSSAFEHRASHAEGHLQTVLSEYTQRVERLVQQAAVAVVAVTSLVVLGIGTVAVAPLAALVSIGGLAILGLAMRPFSASVRSSSRAWAGTIRGFNAMIGQNVRLSQEIVAFGVRDQVADAMDRHITTSSRELARVRFKTSLAPTLYQYGALGVVLAVVALLLAFGAGQDLESAAPVILLLVRALTYAKQLQLAIQSGNELSPFLAAMEAEIDDLAAHPAPAGGHVPPALGRVEVEGVSYSYPGTPDVLRDVDLRLDDGEVVGIVGPSGGGKSTLVQILLRLRSPSSGRVRLGGVDLQDIDAAALARLSAVVLQDNRLIRATVAENIRFYRTGFSDEDVVRAAKDAHLHAELAELPSGYDTEIGPGARDLSGGQRQRLGIARALLGRPALLVLDEPTSALDARSEALIRETLVELRGHTTIVVVAHRPATIEICDRVLRVDRGRVTELTDHRRVTAGEA